MRTDLEYDSILKILKKENTDAELSRKLDTSISNVDDEKRIISFIFSTNGVDRKGDTLNSGGWEVEDFNKNPVFLWQHDITEQPLGIIQNLRVEKNNLVGEVEFWYNKKDPAYWSDFDKKADSVYEQYKRGFIKGASVRFKPLDFEESSTTKNGINYTKQYLLEISAVSIPDNADALAERNIDKEVATKVDANKMAETLIKLMNRGE